MLKVACCLLLAVAALAQPVPPRPCKGSGDSNCSIVADTSGNTALPGNATVGTTVLDPVSGIKAPIVACVGTPGNTVGPYRSLCVASTGAAYSCSNAGGCSVAGDWFALAGTGAPGGSSGTIQYNSGGSFAAVPSWSIDSHGNMIASGTLDGTNNATWWGPAMTYSTGGQIQPLNPQMTQNATAGGGFATMSVMYSRMFINGTQGGTHAYTHVSRLDDGATAGTVTNEFAYQANYAKTSTGTVSNAGAFLDGGGGANGSTGPSNYASFRAAGTSSGSGDFFGLLVPTRYTGASGRNVGVFVGGTSGCGESGSGVFNAMVLCGNASNGNVVIQDPITLGMDFPSAGGSIISTGSGAFSGRTQRNSSAGESALWTGTASTSVGGGVTVATLAAFDLTTNNLGAGTTTTMYGGKVSVVQTNSNSGHAGTQIGYDAYVSVENGTNSTALYGFKLEDIQDSSNANQHYSTNYGLYIGKVKPTTASISGSAYSAYFSDANALLHTASELEYVFGNTTGAGSAALGSNSPAVTNTAPYTWLTMKSSDGSTVYVPAWK